MDIICYRKDASESYIKLVNFQKVEYCKIIKGVGTIPLADYLLEFAKNYTSDLLEGCSRIGVFKVSNVTLTNADVLSFFPAGDYKTFAKVYDDFDSNIFNVTITGISSHASQRN
jgi:Protein of unknown function (DUF1091)